MSQQNQDTTNPETPLPRLSRATPVRPAVWMTSVLAWATVIALIFDVPMWAGIFLCSLTGVAFLSFLVPYIYLMKYDRDALRKEKFSLKGAPEKQLGAADTANELFIAAPERVDAMKTQPLERK